MAAIRNYGIMWKTVSEDCNLACSYCYYSRVMGKPETIRRPEPRILEKVLADYLATCGRAANIAWQGGEPTLAGLNFFRDVVKLEQELAKPPQVISNAIQTNGILIDQSWAEFFKEYRFLVGVSLDGNQIVHDQYRVDSRGKGSWQRVLKGIRWLQKENVDFNILTVVGPHNVRHGRDLMKFYESEGFRWVQFIPQMSFQSQRPEDAGLYAISPKDYGQFLCETFDEWYNHGFPKMSIRYFDNVLSTYIGLTPDLCTIHASCPPHLVIESNGDIYPCDFYLDSRWKLGNIQDISLSEAFNTETYEVFRRMKPRLPETCQSCHWKPYCRGGCPRNRVFNLEADNTPDYFCEAFQMFFDYAHKRLQSLAQRIKAERARMALLRVP
ncbi:MAG: anaerobic sulfatase maturase [Firmicutes bacterium]|nr:anaerobic sulfatase maturase [Bacillota bacterium]